MAASTAFLITVIGLAALWLLISVGLDLVLALIDRATQSCRDELAVERIQRQAQAHQHNLQAARQKRQGWSLTDLDGQRRWLERSQLNGFTRLCRQELGLSQACSLGELRRHWRRSSLHWHPDHGGDPANWLRKQRAYEALRQLGRDPAASGLDRPLPPVLQRAMGRSSLRTRWRIGLRLQRWRRRS